MDDNQLVSAYLMEKVAGRPLPPDCPVVEWDLYGDMEPWEIWERFRGSETNPNPNPNPNPNEEEDLYFFTRLKKDHHPSGLSYRRVIGKSRGLWSLDGREREIVVDGVRCGVRVMRYRNSWNAPENHKRWLIKEYCVCDSRDSYVLCLLRKLKKKTVLEEKRVLELSGELWKARRGETFEIEVCRKRRRSPN